MFSFAMTSGLASVFDKFKILITLRRAQKFGDTGPCKNFDFFFESVKADREISATELQRRLQTEKNIVVSTSTINRCRQGLGWISTRTRYCQMVRDANKPKRMAFCRKRE